MDRLAAAHGVAQRRAQHLGDDCDLGTGTMEQRCLGRGRVVAADHEAAPPLQVEENREIGHLRQYTSRR